MSAARSDTSSGPAPLRFRLDCVLEEEGLTTNAVARKIADMGGSLTRNNLYKIKLNQTGSVSLRALAEIRAALEELAGRPVALDELLRPS